MFYVLGELMLSDMPQPKYSYQRNTCRSHLYYTNERKECLMTQITKERWCQYQLTSLLYRTLFHLSALFLKILKIFSKKKTTRKIWIVLLCLQYIAIHFNTLPLCKDGRQRATFSIASYI